ncbi:alcohol dehydrogenase catalytic domain-containing protein [Bradyrhizobium sp. RD5-C2]|uniref:alcohol dehydrogenase catalytic domain-containing protein n=1 Tax=Bradyrhizobium sp. RD5-C2 TaxID=244562 RepID=UPI0027E463AA|nr:alcohol dehydrogenase catalytic domain-containing protein [Bradyrhizobium sp. RD5-C2]
MTLSIAMTAPGGVDVLKPVRADLPRPAADEVRLRQTAIGVNFVDIYQRMGLYPVPGMPAVLGVEGAGVVEAAGPRSKRSASETVSPMPACRSAAMPKPATCRPAGWCAFPTASTIRPQRPPCCAASPRTCCSIACARFARAWWCSCTPPRADLD